jgi:hypothetical protein
MRNMIGKGLVVATVAAACGYAAAATITVGNGSGAAFGGDYSLEGMSSTAFSATGVSGFVVALTMGAFQSKDSIIQLSLTGARFASSGISTPSVFCTSGNMTLDVPTVSTSQSTWDFGIAGTSGSTSSIVCSFSSLALLASSMSSTGTVSVSSGVKRTSDAAYTYDTATAKVILTVASQISSIAVTTAFNGTVDYQTYAGRGFTANDNATLNGANGASVTIGNADALTVRVTSRDTLLSTASNLSVAFDLSAESGKNFAFLDDNGTCGTSALVNRSTSNGRVSTDLSTRTVTINAACTTVSYVALASLTSGGTRDFTLALGHKDAAPSTGVVIEPMTFPNTNVVVSQGSTTRATQSISPGTWASNGATVVIPYMPINLTAGTSQIDPVVTIANRSTLTGTLTGSMRDEDGNSCTLSNLGTVGATRTKNLGGLIKEAFAGCSNLSQTSTERLYITITATLPDSSTTFFSGYTVGGSSRVSVVNSTQGK